MNKMHAFAGAAVLGLAAFFAPSASAADFGVSVGVGTPPAPVYVDGGYYESVWVEPVYRSEIYYGTPRTVIVTPGYYNRVYRPYGYTRSYGPSFGFGFNFGDRDHHHHYNGRYNDRDRGHHDGYRDKPGRYR